MDAITNFHLGDRTDLLVSYNYLFAGEFLRRTTPPGKGSPNASALYMIVNYRW